MQLILLFSDHKRPLLPEIGGCWVTKDITALLCNNGSVIQELPCSPDQTQQLVSVRPHNKGRKPQKPSGLWYCTPTADWLSPLGARTQIKPSYWSQLDHIIKAGSPPKPSGLWYCTPTADWLSPLGARTQIKPSYWSQLDHIIKSGSPPKSSGLWYCTPTADCLSPLGARTQIKPSYWSQLDHIIKAGSPKSPVVYGIAHQLLTDYHP